MTSLKAILFDIDDTLFSTREFARRARRNAVEAMVAAGVDMPVDDVVKELDEVIREFSSNYSHHFDKLLMRLPGAALRERVNPALVVTAGVVAYHDTKFEQLQPFPDVRPFLDALREVGVSTGIVTHGWTSKQAEKLIRLDLVRRLDPGAIFISDQVGISKPNPKLYTLAMRRLLLEPGETMYVGDNLEHDIGPPQSLGMRTVWSTRGARPDQDVERYVPHHTIDDFHDLARILREEYSLAVPDFKDERVGIQSASSK